MSQDQTQEQSAGGLSEPGSVLSAKEDDFNILKAGYEELSARYATLLNGGCSEGTLDFNFFVENGLAEFLKPSQWLRTTYEAPYQRYE